MTKPGPWLTILLFAVLAIISVSAYNYKACKGTSMGISYTANIRHLYQNLRDRYMNCTHVDGNLEITRTEDENSDLSFLKDIREVTGYVLLYRVKTRRLVLPNLTIIRGRNLLNEGKHALYVSYNSMETLELPTLREISSGGVYIDYNYALCYMNTIKWEEIVANKSMPIENNVYNHACPPCHESCEDGCWGPGSLNCQKISKINCSSECHQRQCFGPNRLQCCHPFCAGGCSGPIANDCLACKNFDDNGVCKEQCPSMKRYNATKFIWETNPDAKYAYGVTCVKNCPEHFLRDDGACVRFCPEGKKDVDGECVSCGGPCPKSCKGVKVIHSGNIHTFKGCTVIEGSLRIDSKTFHGFKDRSSLQRYPEMHPDMFEVFSTLKEITGFLQIELQHRVFHSLSYFRNLEIVHGRVLTHRNAALYICETSLQSLNLRSLRKVRSGNVVIEVNRDLCFASEIEWRQLMTSNTGTVAMGRNAEREDCMNRGLVCHEQCSSLGCWASGPDECLSCKSYKLKETCVPGCNATRGCTGPRNAVGPGGCNSCDKAIVNALGPNIAACKYFDDDGVCKRECPPLRRYNPATFSWEVNPDGKYAYGRMCVKKCPDSFLRNGAACVRSCPKTKKNVDGECVSCDGPCPKKCKVVEIIHAGNIQTFKGCTIIEGFLKIASGTFSGFKASNNDTDPVIPEMHPDELEVFSTLKEVTGFVRIEAHHPDFKNLSYFRNLEIVGGRQFTHNAEALFIYDTSLRSLNLRSLREVRFGRVLIAWNTDLCFAEEIEWRQLMPSGAGIVFVRGNAVKDECRRRGFVCHDQCSSDGCWGSEPNECLSCKYYKLNETCVPACDATHGVYDAGSNICEMCDEECLEECSGAGPSNCTQCRHARDGPYCVSECPPGKYNENGECKPCHESYANGCADSRNTVGTGGCNSCDKASVNAHDPNITVQCLQPDEPCPVGYYEDYPRGEGIMRSLTRNTVCRKCHPRCKNCTRYDILTPVCHCANYTDGEKCLDACHPSHYANTSFHCVKCAAECRGCHGPSSTECKDCRKYRVYLSPDRTTFNCTSSCPADKPHKVYNDSMRVRYCSDVDPALANNGINKNTIPATAGGVVVCIALFAVLWGIFRYQRFRRAKTKEATMAMEMTEFERNRPKNPSNIKPNMARLRIIMETELKLGGTVGSGAFGTVYNAVWVPKGENVKLPVAVKVLRNNSSSNKCIALLDEAHMMASVDHPNVLKLLAISMAARMKLVTPLMPLGCLLNYVRSHRVRIGSKHLLSWCSQIARGMAYLEERHMVHRDLALRNILVQTPECIKITDFGLARVLKVSEEEYISEGGKMPLKWLALECIQYGIYTHKSDVWAFGVTVWELLTYGGRPYENTLPRELPYLLAKGDRLPQPSICATDVYACMHKCWSSDADSRPSFKELFEQFSKMVQDPDRFLVIRGHASQQLPAFSRHEIRELTRTIALTIEAPGEVVDAEHYCYPNTVDEEYSYPNTVDEEYSYPSTVDEEYCYPTEEHEYAAPDSAWEIKVESATGFDRGAHSRQSPTPGCSRDRLSGTGEETVDVHHYDYISDGLNGLSALSEDE